ncbi:hypothetical protein IHV09_12590 [Fictibacillus sp. 23RED33]|uniref:hypothetical protein n=1 Tax=Fictibacillus sp. 23RED33 TaxID=2745879 RepID=UPI0018CCCEBF|nr:hypothetical protein [Fictibacillus sp. 23RED33]MBH0174402.1 hypothetical protein [Fictibacillus sp. 23RED33]
MKRTNVAHRLPRGKRATWNGNQLPSKHQRNNQSKPKNQTKKHPGMTGCSTKYFLY